MVLPRLVTVRQNLPDRRLTDPYHEARCQLDLSDFASRLDRGTRVGIGVGSRGIANIAAIVRSVVDYWKDQGCFPFIFPAMGSHGAATAEGQADVLAHFGIHQATMGCPVISSLDVVSLGRTADGIEAFMERNAFEAAGVMLIGRVKWHTDFAGELESGLFKMMAIGLGKFAGARQYHTFAYRLGLEHVIRTVGRQVLGTGKILGGLAILEDAHHNTAHIEAVPVARMEKREEELLALTKSWMARIPMPKVDVLIVDEIGKNISGAGMDTKVINRSVHAEYNPWPGLPRIERIVARDLSAASYGNGVGIGMADVIHDRILAKINWTPTWINSLTASTPACIRTPIHFSTDRECLDRIAPTVGKLDPAAVTWAQIRNTLELATLRLSENLLGEIVSNTALEVVRDAEALEFDGEGNLKDWWGEGLVGDEHQGFPALTHETKG